MIVYCLNPIDFWHGWMSEAEYRKQIIENYGRDLHQAASEWDEYLDFKEKAFELAKRLGWEGDIRGGDTPDIAGLPADGKFMLGWKQDNNGTTFIASPFRLPWLESEYPGERIEG